MFKKKARLPLDTVPPSGIFVRTPARGLYFVKDGKAFSISEIAFDTWKSQAVPITAMAFRSLESGGRLGFRDGTLVKDFGSGTIYLISNSRKRPITDPAIYESLGGLGNTITVASEYLKIHKEGEPLGSIEVDGGSSN